MQIRYSWLIFSYTEKNLFCSRLLILIVRRWYSKKSDIYGNIDISEYFRGRWILQALYQARGRLWLLNSDSANVSLSHRGGPYWLTSYCRSLPPMTRTTRAMALSRHSRTEWCVRATRPKWRSWMMARLRDVDKGRYRRMKGIFYERSALQKL